MIVDQALVRKLLRAQMPHWGDLPLTSVESTGTDNAIFRLGAGMAVRLPKVEWAAGQATREHCWLPMLAPQLPLAIPQPLALGAPGSGYPWAWTVHQWIAGEAATREALHSHDAADRLGAFVAALRTVSADHGPPCGAANGQRGVVLAERTSSVARALGQLRHLSDIHLLTAYWDDAVAAAPWSGTPAWLHGDLQPANLLVANGQLAAVIDFGLMGVGDPACDLMAAWTCFSQPMRDRFLAAAGADADAVRRGRGWAVLTAAIALAAYAGSNPWMAERSRRTLAEACAD